MAIQEDIVLENSSIYEHNYQYTDAKDAPIPMLGYDAILEIREAPYLAPVVTMRRGDGIILDDSNGDIVIQISKARIQDIHFNTGVYKLVFTYNNKSSVFMRGSVIRKDEYIAPTTKGRKSI